MDRDYSIAQLQHTAWTVKEGAPPDVWALAQAPDGYLWLGTGAGLYRFDGVRFERFQPRSGQFRSNNMTALTALPSGELWIGYYFGGASVLKDGQVTNFGEREGMPGGVVFRFVQDLDGGLWAATAGGLARLDDNRWRTVGSEWGYPANRADWVFVDRDGTLWAATHETLVFLRRGARHFESTGERIVGLAVIAQAQDGTMWLSDDLRGTRALRTGVHGHEDLASRTRAEPVHSKRIIFDRDGNLWATDTVRGGVYRVAFPELPIDAPHLSRPDVQDVFTLKNGLTSDIAVPLLEDVEGNLWVGTNLGLNRFRRNNVIKETRIPATSSAGYILATDDRGEVLVANPDALFRIAPGSAKVLVRALPKVSSTYRGADGNLWFGTRGALLRVEGERLVRTLLPQDLTASDVQAIAGERSGALWVSVEGKGIYRYADGKWQLWGNRADLPQLSASAAASDAQGRIWLGYPDSLVAVLDGDHARTYSARDGLTVGHVMAFQEGVQRLWVGGEFGVAQVQDSRVRTLSTTRVEVMSGISGIIETAEGELWLNGTLGIVRVTLAEMEQAFADPNHRLHYQLFDFRDGLPGVAQQASPVPTAIAAADGKLWFATNHGVVYIDPKRVVKNPIPPPVAILSLVANGRSYAPTASLQLPERTSSVHIAYTALSLSVPERVRFLLKLEGADTQWRDAGSRREAFFTNLDPGDYRFRVIAANNDGVWNEAGASLDFTVLPAFYQTAGFRLLTAAAVLMALMALYRLRIRQVAKLMGQRLEERIVERERIARELHDTLLQGFQALMLRFQAVANRIPQHEPLRQTMESALERADQVLTDGRNRVRDLRSVEPTAVDLLEALKETGRELAEEAPGVELRIVVQGTARKLHPIVRDEAYWIAREAILNAFRHGQAKSVEVEVHYEPREMRIHVRDDGCGVPAEVLEAGGRQGRWGFTGMRERADKIRGQLEIWSGSGAGTEVELRVPGKIAYQKASQRASWLHRFIGKQLGNFQL